MTIKDQDVQAILEKYKKRLDPKINTINADKTNYSFSRDFSKEYIDFRKDLLGKTTTFYENLCNNSEKIVQVKPDKKLIPELIKSIETTHMNITYIGASSFATLMGFLIIFLGIIYGAVNFILTKDLFSILIPLLIILMGALIIKPLTKIPNYLATRWRLRASNQMVLCILYIVMYMRHTSNLEHALKFAIDHIQEPLSLDLRKVFFDVEDGKYSTLKESLDNYLESWRDYNLEFVNSFHLIEGSLYEPNESRRIELLDRSLEMMLTGTYEKMMHYSQNLKNPITMIHMLGVVLPILGLVILPLVSSFIKQISIMNKIIGLVLLYNIFLPIIVFVTATNILSKRPTGYGQSDLKVNMKSSWFFPVLIMGLFIIIGLIPFIWGFVAPTKDFTIGFLGNFFSYQCIEDSASNVCYGPYGVGSLLFSLLIPLGLAFGLSMYYSSKTKKAIKIIQETRILEQEFSGSLFQLGNRIGDGVPAEVALETVGDNMKGTPTGNFFRLVTQNIRNLGMDVEESIFNLKNGAILNYPSPLIQGSMEVLVESSKKGPKVVATSLISISNYVSQIHNVNERLKDLLSDVMSSISSQINFLAPVIAGIVVGIASMIVTVIGYLANLIQTSAANNATEGSIANISAISSFLSIYDTIPSYYFQIIIGLYVVEIIYVLTVMSNGIENGADKITEEHEIGRNMKKSILIYFLVSLLVIIIFNALAYTVLKSTNI